MTQSINTASERSFFIEEGLREIFGNVSKTLSTNEANLSLVQLLAQESSIHAHGVMETKGLMIRAGRAALQNWLKRKSSAMGWEEIEFRLLPPAVRTKQAVSSFITWLKKEYNLEGELKVFAQCWQIEVRFLDKSVHNLDCQFVLGMFQELVSWAGGGNFFPAREMVCQSDGADFCIFEIDRHQAN